MKIHKVEAVIAKGIRDIESELSAMEPWTVTKMNETPQSLRDELTVLQQLATTIQDYHRKQQRQAIDRMSKKFGL